MSAANGSSSETGAASGAGSTDKSSEQQDTKEKAPPTQEKKENQGKKKEDGVTTTSKPKEEPKPKEDPPASQKKEGETESDPPAESEPKADMTVVAFYMRLGDHSIHGDGAVTPVDMMMPAEVEQNAIAYFRTRVYRDPATAVRNQVTQLRISSLVYTADDYGGDRHQDVFTDWVLRCPRAAPIVPVWARYSVYVDALDMSGLQSYLIDSRNINTNTVVNALTSQVRMPASTAKEVAPFITSNLERADMIALYTKGFVLAHMAAIHEQVVTAGNADPTPFSPFTDFEQLAYGAENFAPTFSTALTSRHIIVLQRDFSLPQIRCLAHLARHGTPYLAEGDPAQRPRASQFRWPAIPMLLLVEAEIGLGNPDVFTSGMMVATLTSLATTRSEHADLVRGFVRASVLVSQRSLGEGAQARYFFSTGETATVVALPAPQDSNPIWRWLQIAQPRKDSDRFRNEARVAESLHGGLLTRVGLTLGAFYGLGVGLAMQSNNLTGNVIQAFGLGDAPIGTLMLAACREFLWTDLSSGGVAPIFSVASAELVQITRVVICPSAMIGNGFNNRFRDVGDLLADGGWANVWGDRIPYVPDPLSLAKYLIYWPGNWGIFTGNVSMDTKSEVIPYGAQAGWYADRGESRYRDIARDGDNASFETFIPYGAFLLNAYQQFFRLNDPLIFGYREWTRSYDGPEMPSAVRIAPPVLPDDVYPQLQIMKPGVVISYDWFTDAVLAPFVPQQAFANHWGAVRSSRFDHASSVGVLLDQAPIPSGSGKGTFSIMSKYSGESRSMVKESGPRSGTKSRGSEN
eukprot:TRINITY_DN5352_c0_g1_i1.p1 TRINITY_DN5352_c0_g1~~TRINITY_DN5352_c0_g1_i1.p1  ORF type:complete len:802 (+),score=85.79 TRINITY_DN5352_c0_g1_i1:798-3203(+)